MQVYNRQTSVALDANNMYWSMVKALQMKSWIWFEIILDISRYTIGCIGSPRMNMNV